MASKITKNDHYWFSANLETQIVIDRPISTVWKKFIQFDKLPQYSPFVHEISSAHDFKVGTKLSLKIGDKKSPNSFTPTLLQNNPEKEFRWVGAIPMLFVGEHYFIFESIDNGTKTKLTHGEAFHGLIVGFCGSVFRSTIVGFGGHNDGFKAFVETD